MLHHRSRNMEAYLVPQPLTCDYGHLIANLLVDFKVKRELWVIPLNNDLGGLFDGLRSNATHDGV
jgi:hypothetical protein